MAGGEVWDTTCPREFTEIDKNFFLMQKVCINGFYRFKRGRYALASTKATFWLHISEA